MRHVTLIGVAFIWSAVLGACSSNRTNVDAANDGFVALFDGATLTGWTQRGGNAEYRVEDGCIVGATRPNQPNSFLCTDRTYRDFVLELDFRIDRELNSGIQIRSNSIPDYRNGVVHGYQVEIDPTDRAWTGGLYDESRRGWLAPEDTSPEAKAAFKQGDWNHLRIEAVGDQFKTWLNGVPVVEYRDALTDQGFIGLQVHGVGARTDELTVRWRNIKIREIPAPAR